MSVKLYFSGSATSIGAFLQGWKSFASFINKLDTKKKFLNRLDKWQFKK